MAHAFVTVTIPFAPENAAKVEACLDALGNVARPPVSTVLDESAFVHFMSLTVLRGQEASAHLVLEATADGYSSAALAQIAQHLGPQLAEVLGAAGITVAEQDLGPLLERHRHEVGQGWFSTAGVTFSGTPGMSVVRIRREAELAARIQSRLHQKPRHNECLATLERIRAEISREFDFKWAFQAEPVPLLADTPPEFGFVKPMLVSVWRAFLWPLLPIPALILALSLVSAFQAWDVPAAVSTVAGGLWRAFTVLLAELALAAVAGVVAYRALRRDEESAPAPDLAPSAEAVAEIMQRENRVMQNNLAAVSTMKPGLVRQFTLRLVLWLVAELATYRAKPGFLSGIGTIHFARWVLIPGTDKLIFFSNYSGSWQSYLEDFIERAHEGLTGVWSNTRDFPKTQNLFIGGAKDGDRFKRWARRQQHPTRFWYAAYPRLTTDRIRTNAAIRSGFASIATNDDAEQWLTCFHFAPPSDAEVESQDVPTLVFGSLSPLHFARSLVLRLSDDPADCREWLAAIEPKIAYGQAKPVELALVVGFTAKGMRKLGLDDRTLATFPTAFQHGMAASWRARTLGDTDEDAPELWKWGGPNQEADAVLIIYADTADRLAQETTARTAELEHHHHRRAYEIVLREVSRKGDPTHEPFGFTDGISQPIVRGTERWTKARNSIHLVEPGEMILGYPNNLGFLPPSPCVDAAEDPNGVLPPAPIFSAEDEPGDAPALSESERDLGRNGTFLVVRQLEQNVDAFNDFLARAADKLKDDPRVPRYDPPLDIADWVAAKMVGRWKDGTSLVRNPDPPGTAGRKDVPPDNDFLFGTEDPAGLRCPFGAHIRRANPRESLAPGSQAELAISNRHRIFRVGRGYDPQNGLANPGLLFLCVNADIEGQFEFLQQTWIHEPSFHGLVHEIDPIIGHRGLAGNLTIPTEKGPIHLEGISDFIRVRGGGYFFMPSRQAVQFLAHR